ncbi:MAG: hypothetical protein DYG89_10570 [Caldilinea sp. CFX5]|nr:hypothetical protein [Caldilinea sp. CFX5]
MTKIYTAAVIGAGMGGKLSMKAAAASDRFHLVAVADWREEARREAEALYQLLADQIDKSLPDYTWPAASLTALELCEAAYLANQHRCMISLPLANFMPPAATHWEPGKPYAGQGGGRDGRRLNA